jgi:hypothetical protein
MFSPDGFMKAIESKKYNLQRSLDSLKDIPIPHIKNGKINLKELSEESIKDFLEKILSGYDLKDKSADFVYIIQGSEDNSTAISTLQNVLSKARKSHNQYAFSRINKNMSTSATIYVGRSKSIQARLQQHLGKNSEKIYSLHLQAWASEIDQDIEITVFLMCFHKLDDSVVQAIEDGLWSELKPAFGREGKR